MLIKGLKYTGLGITFGCLASDTFYNKFDRNLLRPIRNVCAVFNDDESFVL